MVDPWELLLSSHLSEHDKDRRVIARLRDDVKRLPGAAERIAHLHPTLTLGATRLRKLSVRLLEAALRASADSRESAFALLRRLVLDLDFGVSSEASAVFGDFEPCAPPVPGDSAHAAERRSCAAWARRAAGGDEASLHLLDQALASKDPFTWQSAVNALMWLAPERRDDACARLERALDHHRRVPLELVQAAADIWRRAPSVEAATRMLGVLRRVDLPVTAPSTFKSGLNHAHLMGALLVAGLRLSAVLPEAANWARSVASSPSFDRACTRAALSLAEPGDHQTRLLRENGISLPRGPFERIDATLPSRLTEEVARLLEQLATAPSAEAFLELRDLCTFDWTQALKTLDGGRKERDRLRPQFLRLAEDAALRIASALTVLPGEQCARELMLLVSALVSSRSVTKAETILKVATAHHEKVTIRTRAALLEEAFDRTVILDRPAFSSLLTLLRKTVVAPQLLEKAASIARSTEVRDELKRLVAYVPPPTDRPQIIDPEGLLRDEPASTPELFRLAYRRFDRITIGRRMAGGYGGGRVYLVFTELDNRRAADHIAKIGPRHTLQAEARNHDSYVRHFLPNNAPRLEESATRGSEAILDYQFLGGPGLDTISDLEQCFLMSEGDEAQRLCEDLVGRLLPAVWWKDRISHERKWKEALYGRLPADFQCSGRSHPATHVLNVVKAEPGLLRLGDGRSQIWDVRATQSDPHDAWSVGQQVRQSWRIDGRRADRLRKNAERLGLECADGHALLKGYDDLLETSTTIEWSFIHGDLQPRNVMVNKPGGLWLIDFAATGEGPPIYDAARLEGQLRKQAWDHAASDPDEVEDLERRLLAGETFPDSRLYRCIAAIRNAVLPMAASRRQYLECYYIHAVSGLRYVEREGPTHALLGLARGAMAHARELGYANG